MNYLCPKIIEFEEANLSGKELMCAKMVYESYIFITARALTLEDYKIDIKLSRSDVVVYRHIKLNSIIVAYSGTDSLDDTPANVSIINGTEDSNLRFIINLAWINELMKNEIIEFITGHSLSGALALYIAYNSGLPSCVFNPAIGLNFKFFPKVDSKIYSIQNDPISYLARNNKFCQKFKAKFSSNPHSLKNFL